MRSETGSRKFKGIMGITGRLKEYWQRKWLRRVFILFSLALVLFMLKGAILRGLGNWLVAEDELTETDMCFVLGGNSYERGMEAASVYKKFPNQKFTATGGNYPLQIRALDTLMFEAELTRHIMKKRGVDENKVSILTGSRSTMEESDEILKYCLDNGYKNITVISSSFHLRRVRWVFEDKFKEHGIHVIFHGSNPDDYNQSNWWHSEEGLIMANNEVVKLIYYFLKY